MTKKIVIACFLLMIPSFLAAAGLDAVCTPHPSSVDFSWSGVPGAVYYDIYNEDAFTVRLEGDATSYTVSHLLSDTDYSFSIAARTADNETLDAAFLDTATGSWDGVYQWVNRTDEDNRGRMRSFTLRVETETDPAVGQYHALYMIMDDGAEVRISPIYDFSDPSSGEWVDYKSDSPAAISYRLNAERFNTSVFKPSRWRVDKLVIDYDSSSAYIQTSALGITVETVTTYRLYEEDGAMKMSFQTEGSGIVSSMLFNNPNPGEGDAFILTRIQ